VKRRALLAAALPLPALAQGSDPPRTIRLIVPVPPGGSVDALARLLARHLTEQLGQSVVVENIGGAGGNLAFEQVANARPDGSVLLAGWDSLAINPSLFKGLTWDPLRSFVPVIQTVRAAQAIAVRNDLDVTSFAALVEAGRQRPISVGTPGNGSIGHLTLELVRARSGLNATHVPYRGGGPAIADLLAGHIDAVSLTLAAITQHVRAGRLRPIAVSTAARAAALPDVPTLAEQGLDGFDVVSWQGILAPAGTPPEAVGRLNTEIARVLELPEVVRQLTGQGLDPVGGPAATLATLLAADVARWPGIVRSAGVRLD
jgi:tripartite-type tricarboxylate transporter receptor subunit TctC